MIAKTREIDMWLFFPAMADQCDRSGTAFFFKQWGGRNKKAAGRDLEGVLHAAFPIPKKRRAAKA
jgi:protein gp37